MVTVFLVADSKGLVDSIRRLLAGEIDLDLIGSATARDAREQVARLRPDVVLVDLAMPRKQGVQVAGGIKQEAGAPLVVVLTPRGTDADGTAAGADACVSRPGMLAELVPTLRKLLAASDPQHSYRSFFEQLPVGLFRTTREGRILDANAALVELLGFPDRASLLAVNAGDLYADPADRVAHLDREEREGKVRGHEVRLRRHDGRVIWVRQSARTVRAADGSVLYYEGCIEDVTDRRSAEESLAEREKLLRMIVDAEPECVKVIGRDGVLLSVNRAGLAFLEADALEQVVGRPAVSFVAADDRPAFEALAARVLRGEPGTLEFEITGLRGRRRRVETHAVPLRGTGDAVVAIIGITRDVTEHRRAEAVSRALADVADSLAQTLDLRVVAGIVVDRVTELLRAHGAAIYHPRPGGGALACFAAARRSELPFEWVEVLPEGAGLTAVAIRERRAVACPDALADPRVTWSPDLHARRLNDVDRARLAVPLIARGKLSGVLVVADRTGREFTEDEVALAQGFVHHAAVCLDSARLHGATERRMRRLESMAQLNRMMSSSLDVDRVLREIAQATAALAGAAVVSVWMVDEDARVLEMRATSDTTDDFPVRRMTFSEGGTGWIATHRQSLNIDDIEADARVMAPEWWRARGLKSYLGLPVVQDDRLLAVIVLVGHDPFRLDADDEQLLEVFVGQVALALRNATLYQASERRRQESEMLAHVARALGESLDLEVVARRIAEMMLELVGAKSAALRVVEPDGSARAVAVAGRALPFFQPGHVMPAGHGVIGRAVAEGRAITTPDLLAEPGVAFAEPMQRYFLESNDRAILAVPLRAGTQVIGGLSVGDDPGRIFSHQEIALVQAVADQAALALENARLFSLETARRAQIEALAGVEREITSELDVDRLLRMIVDRAAALFASTGGIFLLEREDTLQLRASSPADAMVDSTLAVGRGIVGMCAATREGVLVNDYARWPHALSKFVGIGTTRAMAQPLLVSGRVIGVISMRREGEDAPRFSADDFAALERFATCGAIALENARLYAAALHEITERAAAEDALRDSAARFRSLIENALDIITVLDRDAIIRYGSPSIERVLGWAPDELVGRSAFDLIHEDDRQAVLDALQGTAIPGYAGSAEFRFRHKDGSWRVLEAVGRNLLDDSTIQGIVVNSRDVTDRRQAEETLRQTEKIAAMGQLLAGVAHELNNPLSVVVGRASLLKRQLPGGELAKSSGKLLEAAERCARIVKNFLALARQQPAERQTVSLNRVVGEALELLAYPLRVDGVEVVLELEEPLPGLLADPHQLQQVVVNLVTNAHQALRERPAPRRLTVSTRVTADDRHVALSMEDNGPGIPPNVEARLFEPFFTTKPQGVGTGLGLSLCRGIVESHGGTIRVEGRPGRGARFTVELLVDPSVRTAAAEVEAAGASAAIQGKRILVVDDEAEVGSLLAEFLAEAGQHVETVRDGHTALQRLDEEAWDLVLCDIRMPVLSGPALYRLAVQSHPELRRRFVFLTGDTLSPDSREFVQELTVAGLHTLAKPFSIDEVVQTVQDVLRT